jgi:PAS domain S-box-containing protein
MGFLANFSIVRRIALVLIGLVLTGYMAFLLYSQYVTQTELKKYFLSRVLSDTEKRATAVSYFFAERSNDMAALAECRELSIYFENQALGMSMEYGLSASLMEVEDAFRRFIEKRSLGEKRIFTRVLFIDASGRRLIDVGEQGKGDKREQAGYWKPYLVKKSRVPVILADGRGRDASITISLPYLFKGIYSGQIIARILPELVFEHFIRVSESSRLGSDISFIYGDRYLYDSDDMVMGIKCDQLPPPGKFLAKGKVSFTAHAGKRDERKIVAYSTMVPGTPFTLATFIPETENGLVNSPEWLFIITGLIGGVILLGSLILIRTSMRNAILNTRLSEVSIREKAIAEKNRILLKLKAALEQSANSVIITDGNGLIEYVNPYFTRLTGYSQDETIGRNMAFLKVAREPEDSENSMWWDISPGEEWRGELHMQKKSGELYWEYVSISPVKNEDNEIISYVSIRQDITDRKEAEERIIRLNAELEQRVLERTADLEASHRDLEKAYDELKATQSLMLQQEKMASIGQLAAGVAHEINNPIGFMLSNLASLKKYADKLVNFTDFQWEVIKESLSGPGLEPREAMDRIVRERKSKKIDIIVEDVGQLIDESLDGGERVKKIVQNLKSFAHLDETGDQSVDLNQQLDSTINIVWNELKYKVTLNKEYGEIPKITCNGGQINQVFLNMLVNAAQAIEKTGEITIRTRKDQDNISVSISDTGAGIPPDKINRIFEPFFTTKEVGKGTGLGLSISYDIIKKHGGKIEVESEVSRGTTFTVVLPIR